MWSEACIMGINWLEIAGVASAMAMMFAFLVLLGSTG
jgi:hypothetical protein